LSNLILALLMLVAPLAADNLYNKNRAGNRLFEQRKYAEALERYDDALLENPDNKALAINKGSAHFKLGEYDQALKNFRRGASAQHEETRMTALFNAGNAHFAKGEQMARQGAPQALEQFEAARDSYIEALNLDHRDRDAKWNLQLAQQRIEQLKQHKQQQNNKNKNQDDQQRDQQNKQGDNQQKQQQGDQRRQDNQKSQQQQNQRQQDQRDTPDNQNQQQPEPREGDEQQQRRAPQPRQEQTAQEKEQAARLLQQYSDDAEELNKPRKRMKMLRGVKPEKDW
jgi:Ca-activated chloride channel family protein